MVVGRSRSKLTATEREAMARLRERRATGEIPAALSHAVPHTPCELPTFSTISRRQPKRKPQPRNKRFRFPRRAPLLNEDVRQPMCGLGSLFCASSCFGGSANIRDSLSTVGATGGIQGQMANWMNRIKALIKGGTQDVDSAGAYDVNSNPTGNIGDGKGGRLGNMIKSFRKPEVNFEAGSENSHGSESGHISDDTYFHNLMARS